MSAGKLMSILVIFSFALTSINTLIAAGNPITREEAIEISGNTSIVQRALDENTGYISVNVEYWSADYIESLEGKYPSDVTEKLPDDNGAWRVQWINDAPGYHILHFIDELTGQVLYEGWFVSG